MEKTTITSRKNSFDHSFVRLLSTIFFFIKFVSKTMTLRKIPSKFFTYTHQTAEKQNHFQLNAVFYDEQRFLSQFHLSVVTLIDAIYINERCTRILDSNSPSVHVKRKERERKRESDIKKETNVCLSSLKISITCDSI